MTLRIALRNVSTAQASLAAKTPEAARREASVQRVAMSSLACPGSTVGAGRMPPRRCKRETSTALRMLDVLQLVVLDDDYAAPNSERG